MGGGAPCGRNHVGEGTEAGAVMPEQEALPKRGEKGQWGRLGFHLAELPRCGWQQGSGRTRWAGWVAHWALPQGRILLGPEGVPLRRVDVLAANGVIHMLEGILLPPTILPILPKHCSQEQHQIVVVSAHHTTWAFLRPQCCLCRGHLPREVLLK